ncbi:MAG: hypothetical protein A2133_01975 [Actinobacteria bacterium RBG_16_64_13]|nr:MAG: hypothetical protein A2133_01975 [Actinobacteria bacterium RBG_16_64_13]
MTPQIEAEVGQLPRIERPGLPGPGIGAEDLYGLGADGDGPGRHGAESSRGGDLGADERKARLSCREYAFHSNLVRRSALPLTGPAYRIEGVL